MNSSDQTIPWDITCKCHVTPAIFVARLCVRLHSRTLRLWRSVRQTNMASSDSDDAASKSQRATHAAHSRTLRLCSASESRDKIAGV